LLVECGQIGGTPGFEATGVMAELIGELDASLTDGSEIHGGKDNRADLPCDPLISGTDVVYVDERDGGFVHSWAKDKDLLT